MYRLSLLVLLCVLSSYHTIKIESHISEDLNEDLLSLHSSAEEFVDSTWIILITSKKNIEPRLDVLNKALGNDHCTLLYSAVGEKDLLFKVYCRNISIDDSILDDNEAIIDTILNHTLNEYLSPFFVDDEVQIEKNKLLRRPHFFYGNDHTLEYAVSMDARKNNKNKDTDEMNIMMPSTSALNRIMIENFIEINVGWDLDRIDQHTGMLDQRYQYMLNTPDIDIYIIDTGIRVSHSEFEGRALWLINTVGDGINTDMAGHGTFCASEAAGKTFGVAKKARLYAVKVLDSLGDGDLFTIQAGILQVLETSRANPGRRAVTSLSLGGTKSSILENAVSSLTANNIVVSVSAGNSGADSCLYSPAALGGIPNAHVLTVGATDINDYRPTWSNYGQCVSISAPGDTITAAWITSDTSTRTLSGTSMAAPLVAGVAALVLQQDASKSVADVKSIILAWATPNIVDYASVTGGGKNLLYSLIDLSVSIPTSPPSSIVIVTAPPTDGTSSGSHIHMKLFFLLLSTLSVVTLLL